MQYWRSRTEPATRLPSRSSQGFTLPELLAVVVIVSVLAAIAASAWVEYQANQTVISARDELRSGILQAQTSAITHRASWRFSLREVNDHIEWAIHPNTVSWQDVGGWKSLSSRVVLHSADTTLAQSGGTYYVRFGYQGDVRHRLSTLTLDSKNGRARNRCVVISTLIGATRKGKEHSLPKGDRYCY
ncbi:MAG: prepilin-type N-terminal cleavage/methylation domain-containing protein [Cyanobacteria bacterium P01_C01_bin.120]